MVITRKIFTILIPFFLFLYVTPAESQSLMDGIWDWKDIEHERRLASKGNKEAQYSLGERYATGRGVLRNDVEAAKWYTLSANQGHPGAQNNLGVMYSEGRGVIRDHQKANELFKKSSEQGDSFAYANLGISYEYGHGVDEDHIKAAKLYKISAGLCNPHGLYSLGHSFESPFQSYMLFLLASSQPSVSYGYKKEASQKSDAKINMRKSKGKLSDSEVDRANRLAREWENKNCN